MKLLFVIQCLPEISTPGNWTHEYLVSKVVNSTSPEINERLTKPELDKYCESEDWKVTII